MRMRYRKKKPISIRAVQDKQPDRTFYLRDTFSWARNSISQAISGVCNAVWSNLSLDQVSFQDLRNMVRPVVYSGAAYAAGELLTTALSKDKEQEVAYQYQFMLGAGILAFSASHRITDHRIESPRVAAMAAAGEILAISYLYSSSFHLSRLSLENYVSDNASLALSIGGSALGVPSLVSLAVQCYQERAIKVLQSKGAQRSDTASISSGWTPLANRYFQMYHFLRPEISLTSRLFQMGLIAENVLNGKNFIKQIRNVPAFFIDVGPSVIKKLISEQKKIRRDYDFNTTQQRILRFSSNGTPTFFLVKRKDLRTHDLVLCDSRLDVNSLPVSGEVVAFECDDDGHVLHQLKAQKVDANYKANNGEDVWRRLKTKTTVSPDFSKVDLHAIHTGKQIGVLKGSKINLHGNKNVFIRIAPEKELPIVGGYEKKSVINQIIAEHKQRCVWQAAAASLITAVLVNLRSPGSIPGAVLIYLFNVYQMMIPFAETFLRDSVNVAIMKEINESLEDTPMETIDALRVVDFCNVISGYYKDKFPKGAVIVSDKTGTLTTSQMDVLGFWTKEMHPNIAETLREEKRTSASSDYAKPIRYFQVFACAYQNSKKELELEEHAILEFFKKTLPIDFSVEMIANNHLKKTFSIEKNKRDIETFHLGLYLNLGGRLTLATFEDKKILVFCGIPKASTFAGTSLLADYNTMTRRVGVLSRDWCVAHAAISEEIFLKLKTFFSEEKESEIEAFLLSAKLLSTLQHDCTFIINNPLKKGAENFISNCSKVNVPVFVATGDNANACENIAKVLAPSYTRHITIIRSNEEESKEELHSSSDSTIIFAGINEKMFRQIDVLLERSSKERPNLIFAEMSKKGKKDLVCYLKKRGHFVAVNGDGANDEGMFSKGDLVIGHVGEDNRFVPQIEPYVNFSDRQASRMNHFIKTIYEFIDIHLNESAFVERFSALANSQEKVSHTLILKAFKISFEFARAIGLPAIEMWEQHYSSILFDLAWLGISFNEIMHHRDLPGDNKHLMASRFSNQLMFATLLSATSTALLRYSTSGEATNWDTMGYWLSALPFVLKSLFSGFREVQKEMIPLEDKPISERQRFSIFNCRSKQNAVKEEKREMKM